MKVSIKTTIGEIVAQDYRTAAVFSKNGIDFCCKGHRTIEEVCQKKSIPTEPLVEVLNEVLASKENQSIDYKTWPLDLLADYVEKTHHRYIEEKTPFLIQFLDKLCKVHGGAHPELFEVKELFTQSAGELSAHLKKEELILFPFIRKLMKAKINETSIEPPHFGTVGNPVAMMMEEHDNEGERFRKIAKITNNYTPPADACNTYKIAYAMLEEFENDLHKHIHLENNILFPKSIELEKRIEVNVN